MRGQFADELLDRIKYFTQEIVIFREDLLNKLRRNCILPPNEEQEPDTTQHVSSEGRRATSSKK